MIVYYITCRFTKMFVYLYIYLQRFLADFVRMAEFENVMELKVMNDDGFVMNMHIGAEHSDGYKSVSHRLDIDYSSLKALSHTFQ
ncbi:hypothetical protein Hanom_Chr10g00911041 [Helianthus anomalus]